MLKTGQTVGYKTNLGEQGENNGDDDTRGTIKRTKETRGDSKTANKIAEEKTKEEGRRGTRAEMTMGRPLTRGQEKRDLR